MNVRKGRARVQFVTPEKIAGMHDPLAGPLNLGDGNAAIARPKVVEDVALGSFDAGDDIGNKRQDNFLFFA